MDDLVLKARKARSAIRDQLRDAGESIHVASFELGVATSFMTLLSTAAQRSQLSDAVHLVRQSAQGLRALHQIAVLNRLSTPASQGDLADKIGANRGNFNRTIQKFEAGGLVESVRKGASRYYSLTPLGHDVLARLLPGWRAVDPITGALLQSEGEALAAVDKVLAFLKSQFEKFDAPVIVERQSGRATGFSGAQRLYLPATAKGAQAVYAELRASFKFNSSPEPVHAELEAA
ncbi:MarR family winged helix-turn-helix transcriptional regulator [Dyella sp. GSA-30]|uniref:MarR family winged helix-turn-helix transcriptional regulator n=1 Tax=Dyella sp. GSA-30 TaxID=2994496 RepID=UPI0024906117|nr:MarR family winged helix-turn-helix transcriptional regulator [Dyella sp. GSA-30]